MIVHIETLFNDLYKQFTGLPKKIAKYDTLNPFTKMKWKKDSIGSTRSIGKELKLTKTCFGPFLHTFELLLFIPE